MSIMNVYVAKINGKLCLPVHTLYTESVKTIIKNILMMINHLNIYVSKTYEMKLLLDIKLLINNRSINILDLIFNNGII